MRLSPPTKATFGIAFVGIVAGIALSAELGLVEGFDDIAFWLLSAGAVLLVIGVVFRRV